MGLLGEFEYCGLCDNIETTLKFEGCDNNIVVMFKRERVLIFLETQTEVFWVNYLEFASKYFSRLKEGC